MRNRQFKYQRVAMLLAVLGSALALPVQGQAERLYASVSLGGNVSGDVVLRSRSNDRASICDEYINPRALAVPGCTTSDRGAGDGWAAPFESGQGFSANAELGYRFTPRWRIGLVYGYQTTQFDQTVSSTDGSGADFDKISNELATGEESLGAVNSHQLFAVFYHDWPNRSRWTPFAGMGMGFVETRMDFSWLWARSINPIDILTGRDQPNAEEILSNLAGTVSAGRSVLQDTTNGFLVLAGVSYPVTDTVSVELKVQWTRFDAFESDAYGNGVLRSHPPNLRLDGSEPVSTWTRTGDTDRYTFTVALRFALP